jgi:hypothetical protein
MEALSGVVLHYVTFLTGHRSFVAATVLTHVLGIVHFVHGTLFTAETKAAGDDSHQSNSNKQDFEIHLFSKP